MLKSVISVLGKPVRLAATPSDLNGPTKLVSASRESTRIATSFGLDPICSISALSGTDRENRIRYIIPPMFCPECRAEYRAGFTRCSDCDVDLVQELSESDTRVRKARREWTTTPSTIKPIYGEGRKTVHWWALYKRQTGTWPWSSIAIHVLNWVVILFGGGFLIWWAAEHHLSRWQFLGIFLLTGLPYGVVENWAKRRVKLNHLRNRKRLAK
jgi:hypothetical protein